MVTVRVEGRSSVASLLRALAEGMEAGAVSLGAEQIECADDVAAVVQVPDGTGGPVLFVNLRFEVPAAMARHVTAEKELAHPGD